MGNFKMIFFSKIFSGLCLRRIPTLKHPLTLKLTLPSSRSPPPPSYVWVQVYSITRLFSAYCRKLSPLYSLVAVKNNIPLDMMPLRPKFDRPVTHLSYRLHKLRNTNDQILSCSALYSSQFRFTITDDKK